jgi:hypothetical protein
VALFLGVKRPGREAIHSPPSSVEVKNAWSYASPPQYAFMAWFPVKAQGQLYLYLNLPPNSLHIEELRNFYSSPNVIKVIESSMMK